MRQLYELIDSNDPAWPLIQSWIAASVHAVEVLSSDQASGEATILALQVSTHSALGSVALETGGIIVDHGWLRFLGSGSQRMMSTLLSWNGLGVGNEQVSLKDACIVAHDAIGGFFALNGGAWTTGKLGGVFYLAPDSLTWEDMRFSYADFLRWVCVGDIRGFYHDLRWPTWRQDTEALDADHGLFIWPPLVSKGPPIAARTKRIVPQRELWEYELDIARQIRDSLKGLQFDFVSTMTTRFC